jgi:hypothetical protein
MRPCWRQREWVCKQINLGLSNSKGSASDLSCGSYDLMGRSEAIMRKIKDGGSCLALRTLETHTPQSRRTGAVATHELILPQPYETFFFIQQFTAFLSSFPSCTWERLCQRNFVASVMSAVLRPATEAQLRQQVRSQVQLGNEEVGANSSSSFMFLLSKSASAKSC